MIDKLIFFIDFILSFSRKLRDDFVSAFSAQATLFTIISVFPFAMFLLTLLQYLPFSEADLLELVNLYFPNAIKSSMVLIVTEIYDHASGTLISITVLTALWSASKGIFAIMRGLNTVYGIKETRNYFKIRFLAALYTLVFAIMLICTMFLLVFGNSLLLWIQNQIPGYTDVALLIISIRTIVVLCVLIVFFTSMYLFIPNRKSKILKEMPGALITAAGWMIFSYAYSFYIDHLKNFSSTYGSLTAIVLLMLWLYACMYILFFGGEVNNYLNTFKCKDYRD